MPRYRSLACCAVKVAEARPDQVRGRVRGNERTRATPDHLALAVLRVLTRLTARPHPHP